MAKEYEIIWCLGIWEEDTDYVLCEWDIDLLPTLYEKDEIRYEYNQWEEDWSRVSCTVFAAIWMLSDLINYEFSKKEIKEADDLSYNNPKYPHLRLKGQWWYVKDAIECVADWYNSSELSKKYWKVAYYRINKYNTDLLEWVINKLYTIEWNHCVTAEYTKDKQDWMIDWTDFWTQTNWQAVDIINYKGQRSVKNSYKGSKNNIYGLKNNLSAITNFGNYFYVYTLVKEDNFEEVKRLNEIKSECNLLIEHLWKLYHLVNDVNFRWILHYTADKLRAKIDTCNEMLKKLQ